MDTTLINQELNAVAYGIALLTIPTLLVAAIVGVVIAMIQAVTQIQDQSLPQIAKIVAVGMFLLSSLGALSMPILVQAKRLFESIPYLAY